MNASVLLFADRARTLFEWGRIQTPTDWLLPIGAWLATVLWTRYWYRRERGSLSGLVAGTLFAIRAAAISGLVLIFLEPQWRTLRDVVSPSRVVVLVDTSLSMELPSGGGPSLGPSPSRAEQVQTALVSSDFLVRLRERHDVRLARFDRQTFDVARWSRSSRTESDLTTKRGTGAAWSSQLAPQGTETQLGLALSMILEEERRSPLAGIVLISDGAQNAGISPLAVAEQAKEVAVPVFAIGVGSSAEAQNARIRDLVAPARAYQNDHFTLSVVISGEGYDGQRAEVELSSFTATPGEPGSPQIEGAQSVALAAGEEPVSVRFELEPSEVGTRTFRATLRAPNDANPNDNTQETDIEVVDRQQRVLLVAGGPTRDYQFIRNLLHRESDVELDVWLQTADRGVSQDADHLLSAFPETREAMFGYDCVVAFDPDWRLLTTGQVQLLVEWVARQAGGMLVVAGPVHGSSWVDDAPLEALAELYPVELRERIAPISIESSESPRPLELKLSDEGQAAEFLWLGDSAEASQQAWSRFEGVFQAFPATEVKPGATVYANAIDDKGNKNPYWVEQFYGAGRVMFLGSGELWRLRRMGEGYFEQLATKLLRHAAEGRMERGSPHGLLLAERDRYWLGQSVVLRAQLKNQRLEPLVAERVEVQIVAPDGTREVLVLAAERDRPGSFSGQFAARQEGTYRIELAPPGAGDERLVRRVTVRLPDLEREQSRRQDRVLAQLAEVTGGRYYIGFDAALGIGDDPPLVEQLADRSQTHVLSGTPRPLWDNAWVMGGLCAALCCEWLMRRLARLA